MRKSIPLFFIFLFLFSISVVAQELPKWLEGTWHGIGYQAPTNSAWKIDLDYDTKSFNISYPSLNCSGHWELLEYKNNRAIFVEKITEGVENCDNNVKVVVNYIDDNFISVAYFLPRILDDVVASGVLKKTGKIKTKKL